MDFYLGTHRPTWLERTAVPLFISRRTMPTRKLPRAVGRWALDSGGFSELSMYGEWRTPTAHYISEVQRYRDEIGGLAWVAPQDWMCEPPILARTGLPLVEHQARTIDSVVALRQQLGTLVVPVLQGWNRGDYLDHVGQYARRGIDLTVEPLVGVGTVCRRQGTTEAEDILRSLSGIGLRLHAFGVKITGLLRYHDAIIAADSLAWSYNARKHPPLPGHAHKNCANCMDWALRWRASLLSKID